MRVHPQIETFLRRSHYDMVRNPMVYFIFQYVARAKRDFMTVEYYLY